MKSVGTAYMCWLFLGCHRFYLGRPVSGVLFYCTCGGCGCWTILDLFLIPGMVREENEMFASLFRQSTNVRVNVGNQGEQKHGQRDIDEDEDEREDREHARIVEEKRQRNLDLKQQKLDAAAFKQKRLEQLASEIAISKNALQQIVNAWRQDGSPAVKQVDLDAAQKAVNESQQLFREAYRKRSIDSIKVGYLKIAHFARKTSSRFDMPWYVPTLIVGAIGCTLTVLLALIAVNSAIITFAFGGFGFLVGSLTIMCLLFLPDNIGVRKGITAIGQQAGVVSPVESAKLLCEEAQQKHTELLRLHKLKDDYERAYFENKRLLEEYQAVKNS